MKHTPTRTAPHPMQPAIQAWLDTLSPVERHRVCWLLNKAYREGLLKLLDYLAYNIEAMQTLYVLVDWDYSTATGGQETRR